MTDAFPPEDRFLQAMPFERMKEELENSMKIAVDLSTFTASHAGGKDEVAYNLLRGFSKLGHASQIVCICRPELRDIVRGIDDKYEIVTLEKRDYRGKLSTLKTFLHEIGYGVRLNRVVKEKRVRCLLYTNKLPSVKKLACKTVFLPHDIQPVIRLKAKKHSPRSEYLFCFILHLCFLRCDRIIAISDYDRNEMLRFFPGFAYKIDRICNPIRFREKRRDGKREYITAVNIQWDHKNIVTLVRAYAGLADRLDEKLVLVGRKPRSDSINAELEQIIRSRGLEDRVVFTGFADDDTLDEIISKTRIYVNPSMFEGFGMTAVEMMGCGVPTIVARTTAMPETTMGLCRYYEPPTDSSALAAEILDELQNPTEEDRLAEISDRIRNAYDYVNISKQYWEYLTRIGES